MNDVIIWLDNVRKARNLGAIMRLCVALDLPLYTTGQCANPQSQKAVNASAGNASQAKITQLPAFEGLIAPLRAKGFRLVGTSPRATTPFWEADLRGPIALVFGSETGGLGSKKQGRLDQMVKLPMPGSAESLSVGHAVSVLAYEALRQRWYP